MKSTDTDEVIAHQFVRTVTLPFEYGSNHYENAVTTETKGISYKSGRGGRNDESNAMADTSALTTFCYRPHRKKQYNMPGW